MRRLLSNITLALTVFMMMLLLAEGSWRLFIAKGDLGREFDPVLGRINPRSSAWTIRTSEYVTRMRTNADGFRGLPLLPDTKRPHEIRILFIGDSFVEAKQVPEEGRFVEQVGRLLEGQLGRPVTVRALGIGAAEPARELLYYRHLGRAFHPDIVVQVLFPENDLLSMTGSYRFARDVGGELSVEEVWVDPPLPCSWKCQFLRHSELAVQTYRILRRLRETPFADPLLGDFGVYTEAGQQALAREGRFTATAAIVSALRDDVERDHGRFLAVLMPGAFEIHAVWREEIERRYTETDSTAWRPSRVVDLFRDALQKRDIAVVDLRPPFLEYETVHPDTFLYHRLDPHLNPTGHAITASALVDRLSSLNP